MCNYTYRFGAEAEPCWMDNLGTYIKEDASIYPSVLKCIEYYVIDFTQTPPDSEQSEFLLLYSVTLAVLA